VLVAFSVVSGGATLGSQFVSTGFDGKAQITATPTAAGAFTVFASVTGLGTAAIFSETGLASSSTSLLSVLPPALTFTAVQGGGNPSPASIAVSNLGAGTLQWAASISGNAPWLGISSASGATPAVIVTSVDAAGLTAGSYQSAITVISGSQHKTVSVILTVQPPTPAQFTLTPEALVVNMPAGSTTMISRTLSVANAGSGSFPWTATASAGSTWLGVSGSGTVPSTVTVQFNPSGLAAGQYLGNIGFSSPGVPDAMVSVILNVSALPDLISSVPTLEFTGAGGSSFVSQTIPVTTSTGAAASFSASATVVAGTNWLTLNGANGATPGSISAAVNTNGLAAGHYVGYISVRSAGARNTLLVPVVLDLGSAGVPGPLSASPGGVLLSGPAGSGQPAPLAQTIVLSSDTASFSWNAAAISLNPAAGAGSGGGWLAVSPTSGTGNGAITVSANLAALQPGSYTGQVAISATGTSNTMLMIPVTLVVTSGSTPVTPTNPLQPVQPAGNFIADVGVPVALQAAILSPLGTPVIGETVQVAFSTGDAPVILTDDGGGTYTGVWTPLQAGPVSLLFTSPNSPSSFVTSVVTGAISVAANKQPILTLGGAVSAATFTAGMPLGIGSISALFGQNLAAQTATAASFPLPLSLGESSVTIKGIAAPLFYVSPGQINFFVPLELSGQTTATIAVATVAGVAKVAGVPIMPESPGVFVIDMAATRRRSI
jgi:hypothetical protein